MNGIKFCYERLIELMDYVGPCYIYNDWIQKVCEDMAWLQIILTEGQKKQIIFQGL